MCLQWAQCAPVTPAEGVCDIYAGKTPCVAAHSMTRALYGAYAGPLYAVKRQRDGAVQDVFVLAAGGVADTVAQDKFCGDSADSASAASAPPGRCCLGGCAPVPPAVNPSATGRHFRGRRNFHQRQAHCRPDDGSTGEHPTSEFTSAPALVFSGTTPVAGAPSTLLLHDTGSTRGAGSCTAAGCGAFSGMLGGLASSVASFPSNSLTNWLFFSVCSQSKTVYFPSNSPSGARTSRISSSMTSSAFSKTSPAHPAPLFFRMFTSMNCLHCLFPRQPLIRHCAGFSSTLFGTPCSACSSSQ